MLLLPDKHLCSLSVRDLRGWDLAHEVYIYVCVSVCAAASICMCVCVYVRVCVSVCGQEAIHLTAQAGFSGEGPRCTKLSQLDGSLHHMGAPACAEQSVA